MRRGRACQPPSWDQTDIFCWNTMISAGGLLEFLKGDFGISGEISVCQFRVISSADDRN